MQKINIRGFEILQDPSMQGMTLDGVLLEDFIKINRNSKKILEIGSGNGNISILLSKRTTANITAVEIQEKANKLAKLNVENNRINNVDLVCSDILDYAKDKEQVYDIVFSNPPYFKKEQNTSQMKKEREKQIARNEFSLSLEKLIEVSRKILKNMGHLYLVIRTNRLVELIGYAIKNRMSVKHISFVYTKKDDKSLITLVDIVKTSNLECDVLKPIYVYENDKKSEYIEKLYK